MKPSWKGTLTIGLVSVPVHLYATADKKSTAPVGHGVHRKCQTQADLTKHCSTCDVDIPEDELMKGYDVPIASFQTQTMEAQQESLETGKPVVTHAQYAELSEKKRAGVILSPSRFVEVTVEEIGAVKVESTKTIRIHLVADALDLDPLMIGETSYLMNDGSAVAAEAEAVLVEAMKGKLGVGTLTRGGRERHVAIRVYGGGFILHTLLTSAQLKAMPDRPALPKANPQMVALAKQLVGSMEGEIDLSENEDPYAEGLKALVASKVSGVVIPVAVEPTKPKVSSLMEALAASISAKPAANKKRKIA